MTKLVLKRAKASDSIAIADVHIAFWLETYTGIVPKDYLLNLSKTEYQEMRHSILNQQQPHHHTFVAQMNNELIGFVSGGLAQECEHGFDGELYAIYLLKDYQGRGVGRALFDQWVGAFVNENITPLYLWVSRDNESSRFYQKMGGQKGATKDVELGGITLVEHLYFWYNLKAH